MFAMIFHIVAMYCLVTMRPTSDIKLGQIHRRWTNTKTALGERRIFLWVYLTTYMWLIGVLGTIQEEVLFQGGVQPWVEVIRIDRDQSDAGIRIDKDLLNLTKP